MERDIRTASLSLTNAQTKKLNELAGKTLIIRSSSDEDGPEAANAGGNESIPGVPATEEGIKEALAQVVASYFSFKSLKNRSAFTDVFKQMPLCSALVMMQITDQDDSHPIVSGVMMTHKASWFRQREGRVPHVTASYGFGGVVSGKMPSDEWILTDEQAYATIRHKPHRTASRRGKSTQVPNPPDLQDAPCLTEAQLGRIHDAGRRLEEVFQRPMDVEFVVSNDQLYVVQVRPAQAPEMRYPTFLDFEKMSTVQFTRGTTIISGVNQAVKVFSHNVLFATDLNEADTKFQNGTHQAVLIYTPPLTSNTHAEVNLSGQRPPIVCFLVDHAVWESYQTKDLYLCPQRGLVMIAEGEISVRRGLIQHPARPVVSVDALTPALQGAISTQRWTKQVQAHLASLGEQIAGVETPDKIAEICQTLNAIDREVAHVFTDISRRTAAQMAPVQPVVAHMQAICQRVMRTMHQAAAAKRLYSL